jgi:DNA repair protein RecN (Recombination protein N)
MLDRIEIRNFATIEDISFDCGSRLNIITGETGAGKSVLVQAVSMALGGRADISMVRTGEKKALIQIAGTLDGEDVIITRELMASGKSISKINGEIVPLSTLKDFCRRLADIHGQYDNQKILDPDNHIDMLDSCGGPETENALKEMSASFDRYTAARKDYDELLKTEAESLRQQDFFRFEYDYIKGLALRPGEDEELTSKLEMMRNSEKIYSAVAGSYRILNGDEESVLSALSMCSGNLESVSSYSDELASASSEMTDIYYRLEDVTETLRSISEQMDFSEEDIDEVSGRLSAIEDAKRKYGRSVDEIIAYGDELGAKLGAIANFDSEKKRLHGIKEDRYKDLKEKADALSEIRKKNASGFAEAVRRELSDLEFANSEFEVSIENSGEISRNGQDRVEFMISTNPGEPLRPLARTASGGEISRIMLGFKHIIGDRDKVDTMIFDEIDTGISGRTALVVGRKLREISRHHQIICITHLPQIAAYGTDNYAIEKDVSTGRSVTNIEHLDAAGKRKAVARMISGSPDSETAIRAADDLIKEAEKSTD